MAGEEDFEVEDSPVREVGDGSLDINMDAVDDIDDSVDRPSRAEKKKNRFREAWETAAQAEARAKAAEERSSRIEQELARFRAEAEQFAQEHGQRDPIDDPFEAELKSLSLKEKQLGKEWAAVQGNASEELAEQYAERHQQIKDARQRVLFRQEHQKMGASAPPAQDPKVAATRAIMEDEFPDVFKNQKAMFWADAYHRQQLAKGRAADMSLLRESMDAATKEFKLGGRASRGRPPTDEERARYHGAPAGSAGGGGGGEGKTLRMTPQFQEMARSMYPELAAKDPNLAYQKWAKEVWFSKD